MTTRSGSRIYRRAPRPTEDGACPACHRVVSITPTGRRRLHRDQDGTDCTGSGTLVDNGQAPPEVDPDAVAEAFALPPLDSRWVNRDRSRPASRWSGKA